MEIRPQERDVYMHLVIKANKKRLRKLHHIQTHMFLNVFLFCTGPGNVWDRIFLFLTILHNNNNWSAKNKNFITIKKA